MTNEISKCVELEKYVTKIILGLGVPVHLGGYRYIREAILISITDMEAVNGVMEEIFGYSSASGQKRPTNSEFIAGVADRVRLDYEGSILVS